MPSKRYNTEGIIHKLREADVLLSQGSNTGEVCKQLGVSARRPTSAGARPMAG